MVYHVLYLVCWMIKTIFWDFDGVILDSMKIKGDGFVELFKDYDRAYVIEFEKYHYSNGGISRFDKIRYFHDNILKQTIVEKSILELAEKFANIIEKKLYDKSNLISESVQFIKENHHKYNFHIVSGAEHNELNKLCHTFLIASYFKSIDGSPTKKDTLVQRVMRKYNYCETEAVLIGDAMTDYNAAKCNKIGFYGYNNEVLKVFNYIESFTKFIP